MSASELRHRIGRPWVVALLIAAALTGAALARQEPAAELPCAAEGTYLADTIAIYEELTLLDTEGPTFDAATLYLGAAVADFRACWGY